MATLDHISELMTASSAKVDQRSSARTINVDDLATQIGKLNLASEDSHHRRAPEVQSSQENVLVECAQVCAILVKATACLESDGGSVVSVRCNADFHFLPESERAKRVNQAIDTLPRYQTLVSQLDSMCGDDAAATVDPSSRDDDIYRARGKMERALERLRRAAIRVLDAGKVEKLDKAVRTSVTSLLEGIVKVLEAHIQQVSVVYLGFT